MGTGTFYPEKTKFFSGLKVPVPIVPPITSMVLIAQVGSMSPLCSSTTEHR